MIAIGFDSSSAKYIAASFFATYCSGLTHPLDVVKTRLQSHDGRGSSQNLVPKYSSIRQAFKSIYQSEGLHGLFKGFHISLLCQSLAISFFFWVYESRKRQYESSGFKKMDAVTIASVEASVASTIVTQPMWVVKTRMVLNVNKGISQYQNCRTAISEVYRQHGLRGFSKGIQISLLLSSTGVVQMYLYEGAKSLYSYLNIPESRLQEKHFICGGLSKIISVIWSYPLTTIRTRIQQNQYISSQNGQKYKGSMDVLKRALKEQGIRGLYKGISANMMRGVGQKGIYFYCYEKLKDLMLKSKCSPEMSL